MNSELKKCLRESKGPDHRIFRFTARTCGVERRVAALLSYFNRVQALQSQVLFGRTGQVDVRELGQLGRGSVVNALRVLLLLTLIGFGHACVCSSLGVCAISINSLVGGRRSSVM